MKRKIIVSLLLILIIISTMYSISMASNQGSKVPNLFGPKLDQANGADTSAKKILGGILSAVRASGVAIAVIILLVIGTKYVIASAGDRADIKKYAFKYVIGAVILFGAAGLVGIIKDAVDASITVN